MTDASRRPRRIYLVAGEDSGDALGGALIRALRRQASDPLEIGGFGGEDMRGEGIEPPFPLSEVAVMGAIAILKSLPHLWRRAHEVIDHCVAFDPDLVVIIDSPEFTHPIARRLRKRMPAVPIIDYVSPSVWAWRSYRARKMNTYVDEVLALLPFEPAAYRELGGPRCTYVGHPLIERASAFVPDREARARSNTILLLPGSRTSEVTRLMPVFREVADLVAATRPDLSFVVPAADSQAERIETFVSEWATVPEIVRGRAKRESAMRRATAAIAASGTVTLELALAHVPMVVCYRIDWLIAAFRWLLKAHSVVLPNLIAGGNRIPELIHKDCTPEKIAATLLPLLEDGSDRRRQEEAFGLIDKAMEFDGDPPSDRAAARVLTWLHRDCTKQQG